METNTESDENVLHEVVVLAAKPTVAVLERESTKVVKVTKRTQQLQK